MGKTDPAGHTVIQFRREDSDQLSDTLYEEDYQRANGRLVGESWETLDVNTAAFLVAFNGCLGANEELALLPYLFEILLRADRWVWPFELVIAHLRRKPNESLSFETAYKDPLLRQLVYLALKEVATKFEKDSEFAHGQASTDLERAIRDWLH